MSLFDKFQARAGRDQGANRLFVADGGYFNAGDVKGGANGVDIAGRAIMLGLLSPMTRTSITITSAPMAVSAIPIQYGNINIYCSTTYSTASLMLPAASQGAVLEFACLGIGASSFQLRASLAMSLAGIRGSDLSRITITGGSTLSGFLKLACFADGCWSVVFYNNSAVVVENASS
jgi:hypothetical protein